MIPYLSILSRQVVWWTYDWTGVEPGEGDGCSQFHRLPAECASRRSARCRLWERQRARQDCQPCRWAFLSSRGKGGGGRERGQSISYTFYSVRFCSVLFCSVLFCSILFYSILSRGEGSGGGMSGSSLVWGSLCVSADGSWRLRVDIG